MSAPTGNIADWKIADFMQFITSIGISGNNYNKIKQAMEDDSLCVADIKGSADDFKELFDIPKILAKKVRKNLYAIRLDQGVNAAINTAENKENNKNNNDSNTHTTNNNNNNHQFAVNLRGTQGKMTTLRRLFTAKSEILDVLTAFKDEESIALNYKVEKIILISNRLTLKHNKTLGSYGIVSENNLITVIFKTKGGAMQNETKDNEDRVIRFKKYGLQQTNLADCLIGYDDDDEIDRALLDCGKHAMAAETMFHYITSGLSSNAKQKDICCPIKGCGKTLDWQKCTQIADMNRHEYMEWTDVLEKHRLSDMKRCPHCKAYCKRDDGVAIFRMRCIACNGSDWCWNCCQVWKGSGLSMCCNQTCSIIKETNDKLATCDVVIPKGYKYSLPQFRACPRCLTFIEYTTACKHMICSGCDKSFCFVCLSLQDSSGNWPCGSSSDVCKMAAKQQFK